MAIFNPEDSKFYCECGCGKQIHSYARCARGHHMRMPGAQEVLKAGLHSEAARTAGAEARGTPEYRARQSRVRQLAWEMKSFEERVEDMNNSLNSEASRRTRNETNRTPEARARAGRRNDLNWAILSPEERTERLKNGIHSEASKEAHADTCKTPEYRARNTRRQQEYWESLTPQEREERVRNSFNSEAAKKAGAEVARTPESRARHSKGAKLYWASLTPEEKAERMRNRFGFHSVQSPNGPETMLQRFLDRAFPGMFIPDWIERANIGGRHPDFRTKNGCKLVIESNGERFHGDWGEEEQVTHYRKYGYDCIVVWANCEEDIIFEWPSLAIRIREIVGKN